MTATTVEATLQYILPGGDVRELGQIELPTITPFRIQVAIDSLPECTNELCPCKALVEDIEAPAEIDWKLTLESLLPGTIVADRDHDDWEKLKNGDWNHKGGPNLRSKSLAALYAPFNVVRTPEV